MTSLISLPQLLGQLKRQGWSPGDRARVYLEWRNLVRASLVRQPPTPWDERLARLSEVAQAALCSLKSPDEMDAKGAYIQTMQQFFLGSDAALMEGGSLNKKTQLVRPLVVEWQHTFSKHINDQGYLDLANYCFGYPQRFHALVRSMEVSEKDLEHLLNEDRMNRSMLPDVEGDPSLAEAKKALANAFQNSGLRRLEVPALDAENPRALMGIAKAMQQVGQAFSELVGQPVPWAMPDTVLLLGAARSSNGFFYPGVIATAANLPFPLPEVLAHENIHALDDAMEKKKNALVSSRLKQGSKAKHVKPWMRLMSELHSDDTISMNTKQWKQARQGLIKRWKSSGISMKSFAQSHQRWNRREISAATFYTHLVALFEAAGHRNNAEFRANTLLVECRMLRRSARERPIWQQATYEFGQLAVNVQSNQKLRDRSEKSKVARERAAMGAWGVDQGSAYVDNYFENPSEVLARSFQLLFPHADERNPFAQRWLVYPDAAQAGRIRAAWSTFFKDPHVQALFQASNERPIQGGAPQAEGSLGQRIRHRRTTTAAQDTPPLTWRGDPAKP